jgi:hypothetical protein
MIRSPVGYEAKAISAVLDGFLPVFYTVGQLFYHGIFSR